MDSVDGIMPAQKVRPDKRRYISLLLSTNE